MYRYLIALALALAVLPAHVHAAESAVSGCGVERWPIKTGTDVDAPLVNRTPIWTSIGRLDALPAPATLPATRRIRPVELTTYRLTVTLVEAKLEADSDIHLVIRGTLGATMIAEIPSPACVEANSPFAAAIATARASYEAQYRPSGTWTPINRTVHLSGVGFYDFRHGQTGLAPNAIEIHPILSIVFPSSVSTSADK